MKRKLIAFVFAVMVLLCACGKTATPIEDFEYEMVDGEIVITGYLGTELEVYIPDEINDRPVTRIGEGAFEGYDMKLVVFPDTLEVVEEAAFSECDCLTEIVLPDNLKRVEGYAFSYCDVLESVSLPDELEYLGDSAFGRCDSLDRLELPENFDGFEIETVSISAEWTSTGSKEIIGDKIFSPVSRDTVLVVFEGSPAHSLIDLHGFGDIEYEFYGEYTVNTPGDVDDDTDEVDKRIESSASDFEYTENTDYTILDGRYWNKEGIEITKYVGNKKVVVIPSEIEGIPVTAICESAFEGSDIEEVYIHDGIVRVEERAFADCKKLESVIFADSEILLMKDSFTGCVSLKELHLPFNAWLEEGMMVFDPVIGFYNTELLTPVNEADKTAMVIQRDSYIAGILSQEHYWCNSNYEIK